MCLFVSSRKEILQTANTHIHTHISASSLPSERQPVTQPFVWKTSAKERLRDERQTIDPRVLSCLTRPCPARANIGFSQYKSRAAKWLHSMHHQSCPKHRAAACSKHRNMKYSAWQRRHNPAQCSSTSQLKFVHVHHQQMSWNSRAEPCGLGFVPAEMFFSLCGTVGSERTGSPLNVLSSNVVGWCF